MVQKSGSSKAVTRDREQQLFALYDAHVDTVYRYVYRRCRDHGLAEDVTQDAFLDVVRSDVDPSTVTVAWLQIVARNKLVDVLRRHVRYEEKLRIVANSFNSSSDPDPTDRLRIEQALERIPVHYRLVITLHYLNGMTVKAIAKELDRSHKSVESLITRARRALVSELEDAGDAERSEQ